MFVTPKEFLWWNPNPKCDITQWSPLLVSLSTMEPDIHDKMLPGIVSLNFLIQDFPDQPSKMYK